MVAKSILRIAARSRRWARCLKACCFLPRSNRNRDFFVWNGPSHHTPISVNCTIEPTVGCVTDTAQS